MIKPTHRPSQVLCDSGPVDTPAGIDVDDTGQMLGDGVSAIGNSSSMPTSKAGIVTYAEMVPEGGVD